MVLFKVSFWDYYREKWKEYEVECPDNLETVSDYAECITDKLADSYAERLYRSCVRSGGDPEVCRAMINGWKSTYKEKMYPIIEEFLISISARKEAKRIARKIAELSDDVLALLKSREISLIRYGECRKKGRECRMGLSSTNLLMFDTDCRKWECLEEMLKLAYLVCKVYGVSSVIYPTRRGFHLLGLDPVPRNKWREAYILVEDLVDAEKFKHVDKLHIAMSLARGFSTLSVSPRRDVHYLIQAVYGPEREVIGCTLWYSPIAMYRDRAIEFGIMNYEAVKPLLRNEMWRQIRDKWVKFLEAGR